MFFVWMFWHFNVLNTRYFVSGIGTRRQTVRLRWIEVIVNLRHARCELMEATTRNSATRRKVQQIPDEGNIFDHAVAEFGDSPLQRPKLTNAFSVSLGCIANGVGTIKIFARRNPKRNVWRRLTRSHLKRAFNILKISFKN